MKKLKQITPMHLCVTLIMLMGALMMGAMIAEGLFGNKQVGLWLFISGVACLIAALLTIMLTELIETRNL